MNALVEITNQSNLMHFYLVDNLSTITRTKIISVTTVIKKNKFHIQKRFTGNKNPGHAHKIMTILNNKKQPQISALNSNSEKIGNISKINEVPYDALPLNQETISDKDSGQTSTNSFLAGLKNSMNYVVTNSLSDTKLKSDYNRFIVDKNTSEKSPKFVIIEVSEDFRKADNAGSPLHSYELNHLLIMEVNSGIVFAQFTSSKNAPNNFKISDRKLDGSLGNQYISIFKYTRRFTYNDEFHTCGYKINKVATKILTDNKDHYNFIKDRFNDFKHRDSVDRVHKHDSRFYEENGVRSEVESKSPLPEKNLKMKKFLEILNNPDIPNDDNVEDFK